MICISCGTKDGKFYQIESERESYDACNLCLLEGMNKLRKIQNPSKEESELFQMLEKIVGGQVIRA